MIHMAASRRGISELPCWHSFSRRIGSDRKAGNQVSVNAAILTANTPIGRSVFFFNIVYDCVGMQSDSLSLSPFLSLGMDALLVGIRGFIKSRIEYLCNNPCKGEILSVYDGEKGRWSLNNPRNTIQLFPSASFNLVIIIPRWKSLLFDRILYST